MSHYSDLLRDPRWQKKRLLIFERDGWRCTRCERSDLPLQVHHVYYVNGWAPWGYPNQSLVTLCEPHHEDEEASKAYWDARVASTFRHLGATNAAMERLVLIAEDLFRKHGYGALGAIEHSLNDLASNK